MFFSPHCLEVLGQRLEWEQEKFLKHALYSDKPYSDKLGWSQGVPRG